MVTSIINSQGERTDYADDPVFVVIHGVGDLETRVLAGIEDFLDREIQDPDSKRRIAQYLWDRHALGK